MLHWGSTITNSSNYQHQTWRTPISLRKDIRCSCKHYAHVPAFGMCLRQNNISVFTEHRHLIHMSRLLQLDGGKENGRHIVILQLVITIMSYCDHIISWCDLYFLAITDTLISCVWEFGIKFAYNTKPFPVSSNTMAVNSIVNQIHLVHHYKDYVHAWWRHGIEISPYHWHFV